MTPWIINNASLDGRTCGAAFMWVTKNGQHVIKTSYNVRVMEFYGTSDAKVWVMEWHACDAILWHG